MMTFYKSTNYKHYLSILASVLPQFYLVWVLIDVWINPMQWDDGHWVSYGVTLIAIEFFLLHSGVFMSGFALSADSTLKRFQYFSGLFLFYGVFIVSLALISDSLSVVVIFGIAMLGRLTTLIISVEEQAPRLALRSVYGAILYVVLVPASIFLPIPELGITYKVTMIAFPDGEGVWTRQPERGLAMAIAYFSIMALLELFYFSKPVQLIDNSTDDADDADEKK